MLFTAEKRTAIIKYMLDKIRNRDRDFVKIYRTGGDRNDGCNENG